jgi:hypothetical protein
MSGLSSNSHLDDIGSPGILRTDARNRNSGPQSLDEVVLQAVHLLEVGFEVRHCVEVFVQVRPNSLRLARW